MRPETFYGPQYRFFDRPQLILEQMKGLLFWPEQIKMLGHLYFAPIEFIGIGLFIISIDPARVLPVLTIVILIPLVGLLKIIGKDSENLVILLLVYILLTMIFIGMW